MKGVLQCRPALELKFTDPTMFVSQPENDSTNASGGPLWEVAGGRHANPREFIPSFVRRSSRSSNSIDLQHTPALTQGESLFKYHVDPSLLSGMTPYLITGLHIWACGTRPLPAAAQ